MEYFTGATDKFYRGKNGQIYLRGDGTLSYKNKLVEGMHIDVYMAATNPSTVLEFIDESESDLEIKTPTQSASQPMRDEWFTYECEVSSKKRSKMVKCRKHKTTKRNKRANDDKTPRETLIYCSYCSVHHGPDEPCFNDCYDSDDDLWDYQRYSYYSSYPNSGCCCCG